MRRVMCVLLVLIALVPVAALAQNDQQCFPETGQCISGRIRQYWNNNGGLPVFGFPITPQREEQIEGKPYQVQWFERNRLELHPESARPYDVLLGRLGADRLAQQNRDWNLFPKTGQQPNCRYFPETQQRVCGAFLTAWRANGLELDGRRGKSEAENLALWGLPLSDPKPELLEGREYMVQWFERGRFELHPEVGANAVLFGLLGNEVRAGATVQPIAVPPDPAPQPTVAPVPQQPQPPTQSYNNCQADPNAANAPNYPVKITGINKAAETVTLQNVSGEAVNLDGWHMCSIKGNQLHPIGGPLAPGETKTFPGPAGNIWSNSERDDGALYNPQGQLISYWND